MTKFVDRYDGFTPRYVSDEDSYDQWESTEAQREVDDWENRDQFGIEW